METHKLIDGVALAKELVADCADVAAFKAIVAEKNANGACWPWNEAQQEQIYAEIMAELTPTAPKPAKGKNTAGELPGS